MLKRAELRDLWEGEDGFNSRKSDREEEIVKESWDDGEDTNLMTKAPEQVVKKDFVNKEKESTTETKPKNQDVQSVLKAKEDKNEIETLQKRLGRKKNTDNDEKSVKEIERLNEMRKLALSRHAGKRRRKRRPYVKKKKVDDREPEQDKEITIDKEHEGTMVEIRYTCIDTALLPVIFIFKKNHIQFVDYEIIMIFLLVILIYSSNDAMQKHGRATPKGGWKQWNRALFKQA